MWKAESDSEPCYVHLLAVLVKITANMSVSLQYNDRSSECECLQPGEQNGTDSQFGIS